MYAGIGSDAMADQLGGDLAGLASRVILCMAAFLSLLSIPIGLVTAKLREMAL